MAGDSPWHLGQIEYCGVLHPFNGWQGAGPWHPKLNNNFFHISYYSLSSKSGCVPQSALLRCILFCRTINHTTLKAGYVLDLVMKTKTIA